MMASTELHSACRKAVQCRPLGVEALVGIWSCDEALRRAAGGDTVTVAIPLATASGKGAIRLCAPGGSPGLRTDSLVLQVPLALFDAIGQMLGGGSLQIDALPAIVVEDDILASLGSAIAAQLRVRHEHDLPVINPLVQAAATHVALRYGGMKKGTAIRRGGLAPWQLRRTLQLFETGLAQRIDVGDAAEVCGLSVSHFSRAFRQAMGMPPHQWLVRRRVEMADRMLGEGNLPISEIALACGFADQSHLTRAFSRLIGTTPGSRRRSLRNASLRAEGMRPGLRTARTGTAFRDREPFAPGGRSNARANGV